MPYFYSSDPNQVVLEGELDFDKTKHPREIYKRLCKIAEEVGAMVSTSGIHHGGRITVYPAFSSSYHVLNMYELNEDPSTLQVMSIDTWTRSAVLDLMKVKNNADLQATVRKNV